MEPPRDIFAAQAELSRVGAALIASELDERLSVMLRTDGRRQIILRFRKEEVWRSLPLEWFRGFRVTFYLTEDEEVAYAVEGVEHSKKHGIYYLTLAPITEGDRVLSENITGNTVPTNIARVELAAGEIEIVYTYHELSTLFVLKSGPQPIANRFAG